MSAFKMNEPEIDQDIIYQIYSGPLDKFIDSIEYNTHSVQPTHAISTDNHESFETI